jgi:hypothetical protein
MVGQHVGDERADTIRVEDVLQLVVAVVRVDVLAKPPLNSLSTGRQSCSQRPGGMKFMASLLPDSSMLMPW